MWQKRLALRRKTKKDPAWQAKRLQRATKLIRAMENKGEINVKVRLSTKGLDVVGRIYEYLKNYAQQSQKEFCVFEKQIYKTADLIKKIETKSLPAKMTMDHFSVDDLPPNQVVDMEDFPIGLTMFASCKLKFPIPLREYQLNPSVVDQLTSILLLERELFPTNHEVVWFLQNLAGICTDPIVKESYNKDRLRDCCIFTKPLMVPPENIRLDWQEMKNWLIENKDKLEKEYQRTGGMGRINDEKFRNRNDYNIINHPLITIEEVPYYPASQLLTDGMSHIRREFSFTRAQLEMRRKINARINNSAVQCKQKWKTWMNEKIHIHIDLFIGRLAKVLLTQQNIGKTDTPTPIPMIMLPDLCYMNKTVAKITVKFTSHQMRMEAFAEQETRWRDFIFSAGAATKISCF